MTARDRSSDKDVCACGNVKWKRSSKCRVCARSRTQEQRLAVAIAGFWKRVGPPDANGCWPWLGAMHQHGYGCRPNAQLPGGRYAHRVSYVLARGHVPEGLQIDHLCRNRACVNPDHLEAVTQAENIRRGAAVITHCPHGHEYTPDNTYRRGGRRLCRSCHRMRERIRYHTKIGPRAEGRSGYRLKSEIEIFT